MLQADDLGAAACGLTHGYVQQVKASNLAGNFLGDIRNDMQISSCFNVAQAEAYMLRHYPIPGLNLDDVCKVVIRTAETTCSNVLYPFVALYGILLAVRLKHNISLILLIISCFSCLSLHTIVN